MRERRSDQIVLVDATATAPDDPAGFARWVGPHLAVMTAVAAGQVPSAEVDDVVQDALVRAWRRRSTFDSQRGTARGWLVGVLLDQARRRRLRRSGTPSAADAVVVVSDPDTVGRLHIEQAVARLPRRQREVVALHYLADLKLDEVATVLGISLGSVKSSLFDARRALRILLEER